MSRTTQPTTAEERAREIVRVWVEEDATDDSNTGTFEELEAHIVCVLTDALARAEKAEAELRDAMQMVGVLLRRLGGTVLLHPEDFAMARGRVVRTDDLVSRCVELGVHDD